MVLNKCNNSQYLNQKWIQDCSDGGPNLLVDLNNPHPTEKMHENFKKCKKCNFLSEKLYKLYVVFATLMKHSRSCKELGLTSPAGKT